jgi:hypothetical protein
MSYPAVAGPSVAEPIVAMVQHAVRRLLKKTRMGIETYKAGSMLLSIPNRGASITAS